MIDPLKHFLITMFCEANDVDKIFSSDSILKYGYDYAFKKYASSITSTIQQHTHFINDDKINLMGSMFCDKWSADLDEVNFRGNESSHNLFYALCHYTSRCLRVVDGKPKVKFEQLFKWNELTGKLGQDMLLCSFMAYKNRYDNRLDYGHKIPLICGVDNKDLNLIYQKGLVELHQHLKASCDIFSLSWVCLMNKVTGRLSNFKDLDKENYEFLFKSFYKAAKLRFYIFNYLKNSNTKLEINDDIEYYEIEKELRNLQTEISIYNYESGQKIDGYVYDYALKFNPFDESNVSVYDGEQFILYNAFKHVYENPDNLEFTIKLYKYLLAKIEIRKLLVQQNESVGFGNFKKFEGKKEVFLENYIHYQKWCEMLPLRETKQINKISAIESRVAPKNTCREIIKHQKHFHKQKKRVQKNDNKIDCRLVYHFIKDKDIPFKKYCERHRSLRKKIRVQAQSIASAYKSNRIVRSLTVGIDAANNELHCRPEVFAQAFRYMKQLSGVCMDYNTTFQAIPLKSLGFTFHTGEDFYDIADGLRAIDEAIMFLQLDSGDRLGHCIALGQNVDLFYSKHNNSVIISNQCLIDNCAWLIHKARIFNIKIEPKLEEYLLNTFTRLSNILYDEYINIDTYYKSMIFRGDNPGAIFTKNKYHSILNNWYSYNFDDRIDFCHARNDEAAKELYYRYHYDKNVRCNGDKVDIFKVDCSYIKLIEQIQENMMDEIERKGIIIECCPTSNFKIGTNNRYEDLPIFRFNTIDSNKHNLKVTINTDDLGVFQTSLDNEFSLIALSALKKKDVDGNLLYKNYQVYDWLDRIRENGKKYRFVTNEEMSEF